MVRDGKAIFRVIGKKFDDDTFKQIVRKNVTTDSVVVTDAHNGYTGLDKEYLAHGVVNHSIDEYERDGYHTNTVEGFFSYLKRSILGIYHHVSPEHLQKYCEENAYRYTSRKINDAARFKLLIAKTDGRLRYDTLINKVEKDRIKNQKLLALSNAEKINKENNGQASKENR